MNGKETVVRVYVCVCVCACVHIYTKWNIIKQ